MLFRSRLLVRDGSTNMVTRTRMPTIETWRSPGRAGSCWGDQEEPSDFVDRRITVTLKNDVVLTVTIGFWLSIP